jgi:biopolymer transport protein TolR
MAGGMDLGQSSGGGKKPLDMSINLVPFIDLMAVTIAFLIMTAVWTQIGRLQVSSAGAASEQKEPEPPEPSVPVTLQLSGAAMKLTVGGTVTDALTLTRDTAGRMVIAGLRAKLDAVRTQLPQQHAITIEADEDVRYEDLVRVIDTCIGAGLPGVRVSPAAG